MTSSGGDGGSESLSPARANRAPTWPRVAAVVALFVVAFFVAKGCQDREIKVSQDEAVAIATDQVDFTPEDTQVRLLRQGIERQPYWIVSLSILSPDGETYDELAVVRIDAGSGKVVEFRQQKDAKRAPDQDP